MGQPASAGPTDADEARGRPLAHLVLEFIWYQEGVSRAEIARTLGLSRSTVSEIVSDLLQTGLVEEGGEAPSRGGRRPTLLVFRAEAHIIVGIDLGASHVAVAVTDLRGRVLAWDDRSHPVRTDPDGTRALVREMVDAGLDRVPDGRERLMGIGIAVPSPVDATRPFALPEVVMPAWKGRTGFEVLAEIHGVPVFVDNDANLGAVAEHWWGGARGLEDFTYIKVGTGVGSGHMIRGEIYRGSSSVAGEIGHLGIDPAGEPCLCGNRGCLTTFVGAEGLVRRARELLPEYPGSLLAEGEITAAAVEEAALADDPLAVQVVTEAAHHLGVAIAGLLNLLNPAAVILGGGISRTGDRLLVPLREAAMRRTLVSSMASARIQTTALGRQAFAVGAATHVLSRALSDPTLFPALAAGT